ncbi:hypothetical protein GCM10022279_01160 [Comamonas faecalis]|uniref:HAMP domain-containing protein n=1 Tax=Comamonas faecalis TaxID=1387849 RepID=A0ABP7QEN1_9BURK
MHLKDLTVAHKLWGAVLGGMGLMLALGLAVVGYVEATESQSRQRMQAADARIATTMQWKSLIELSTERFVVSAVSSEPQLVGEMARLSRKNNQEIADLQDQIESSASSGPEQALLARLASNREQFRQIAMDVYRQREAGNVAASVELAQQQLRPATDAYVQLLGELVSLQEGERAQAAVQGQDNRRRAYVLAAALTAALVLAGAALALALVRSITMPLARAVGLADAIARGDLTRDVHDTRRDELGQLLRSLSGMARQLRVLVGQVRGGVQSVSAAAGEIASGNHDLSARTEQAAASLQQTAASMEQLTATVSQSADTARQANQLASSAAQVAAQGGERVDLAVASMRQITESSQQIADIIQVIDSIAFQTNILALNAAVEAARAGEQGRGFAVVAGEVRGLAQRSAGAARQIRQLIGASVDSVHAGSEQVEQAGRSMHDIVQSVQRVSALIGEITAASAEQAGGIAQVNQAVADLDRMTQQNAALVEQSSAAAAAMSEQAQRLAQEVAVFVVGEAAQEPTRQIPAACAAAGQIAALPRA